MQINRYPAPNSGYLPVYKVLPTPSRTICPSHKFPWCGMVTPCHREGNCLGLEKDLPKVIQWDSDKATAAPRPLESHPQHSVLAPNQMRKTESKDCCAGAHHTRAIISSSPLIPVPGEPFLWSISSCHWLPLFWPHLAHSKNPTDQNPRAANPTSGCSPH